MKGQFQIYKKTGALQVSVIPYSQEKHKTGAIYLEAAICTDPKNRRYDWANKVKFAMGQSDLNELFSVIDKGEPSQIRLYHAPPDQIGKRDAKGKGLQLQPGEGQYEGTWMMRLEDQATGSKVTCPISRGEFRQLIELIRAALPLIYGWDVAGSYDALYRERAREHNER